MWRGSIDRYVPERREDFHVFSAPIRGIILYIIILLNSTKKNANQSERAIVKTDDGDREDRRSSSRGRVVVVRCFLSFIIHRGHLRGSRLVFEIEIVGCVGFIIIGRRE